MHGLHSGILRERLRELSPQLCDALERSWEIALDTWLHIIGMNAGSTNSYPHLRNVEHYLDQVITEFEAVPGTSFTTPLTAAELYLLLAAVLFHDIGRIWEGQVDPQDGQGENAKSLKHAQWSERIIEKNHADLGIPSVELAKSLAKICLFHDSPPGERTRMLEGELVRTVVDPYGDIREPLVAALLTLADAMDDTHTRVVPLYLAKPTGEGIIALFRQIVRGVRVDAAAGMIRTVLTPDRENCPLKGPFAITLEEGTDNERGPDAVEAMRCLLHLPPDHSGDAVLETQLEELSRKLSAFVPADKYEKFPLPNSPTKQAALDSAARMLYWLLARGDLRIDRVDPVAAKGEGATIGGIRWETLPADTPTAIVLSNLRQNDKTLGEIRMPLADAGIRLAAWLMDDREQLYTYEYKPTYEPVFSKEFLRRVARAMWEVSTPVFGVSQFSYGDLASQVCDRNTEKVRLAVQRIAIVTRRQKAEGVRRAPIWAGP